VTAGRAAAWVAVGVCVVIFARKLDWDQVARSLHHADLGVLVAAMAVGIPVIALQGLKWSSLVRAVRRIPRRTVVAVTYVGQAASAFLPMRAGEAVRLELLARKSGIGRATSLGTVALDHSVNGLVMFAFAAFLPALLPVPRWMAVIVWAGMAGTIALAAILLRLARHPETAPPNRLAHLVARVRGGLVAARNPKAVALAAGYSALAWSVEIAVAVLALSAFHLPHDLAHAMGVLFGVNLAMAIPAPPASLGNFELGAGMALAAFGGDADQAAAFAIAYHVLQLLPTVLIGGAMMVFLKRQRHAPMPPPISAASPAR
jgi:uncharacterized membrane protein YbhN (UPF0104 family)